MTYIFNKLTPKNDIEIDESQIKAMRFVLSEKDITNVAISGNYGAGKSSFIETYKTKDETFNPIHLSLSHFTRENKDESENESDDKFNTITTNEQVNILEGKVINQLLHRIDPNDIPMTIFKSKQNPSNTNIGYWTALLAGLLFMILFLVNYNIIASTLVTTIPPLPRIGAISRLVAYAVTVIGAISRLVAYAVTVFILYKIIYQLVKLQFHQKLLRNISFKGAGISGQIEVFQNSNISYFDKYLDDVLYLFENCKTNVIIFEDIDRFETNLIFEKLREINTLVNGKKKNGEKLLFIYLIKDDMFISRERTKFFDFIIPIIPVITSSNAGERFTDILKDMHLENTLDKKFLQKISIYVDEMRLVYNICNEFAFYRSALSDTEKADKLQLVDEKLFAMIVYKNIFPKDFSYLQMNSGLVYKLLQEEISLKKHKREKLNKEISTLKSRIMEAEQEFSRNKLELYSIFLKVPEGREAIKVDGKLESEFPNRIEFIRELLKEGVEIKSTSSGYSYNYDQVENFDNIFPNDEEFQNRLKKLKDRENINSLNDELISFRKELSEVSSEKIAHLLERSSFDDICSQAEFGYLKSDEKLSMIFFLIQNGYIDKGYSDYITYFYPNTLKKEDKEFLIAVQGDNILEEDYSLTEISEVYDRLDDSDFNHASILNYDLLKYTLTEGKIQERINSYIVEERYEFLNRYLQNETIEIDYRISLIVELLKSDKKTLRILLLSDNILNRDKVYITNLLLSLTNLSLYTLDSKLVDVLVIFIEENWKSIQESFDNFSDPLKVDNSQIQANLSKLNVKITDFDFDGSHGSMSQYVYDHNLYAINMANITNLISYLDSSITEEQVKNQPISITKLFKELSEYIQENIEDYVKQIIRFSGNSINDKLPDVYEILNNKEVVEETRIDYMKCLSDEILNVTLLETMPMIDAAFKFNKIICNTQNLMDSFNEYEEWNELLLDFVNSKLNIRFEKTIFDKYSEEQQRLFFRKTAMCNKLKDEHYRNILSVIGRELTSLPDKDIDESKINILIKTRSVSSEFSVDVLKSLRERYPNQVNIYILEYIDSYIQEFTDINVYNEEEALQVLDENITIEDAISIVDCFKTNISIQNKAYSAKLQGHILKNRFDEDDLEYIVSNYSDFSKEVQKIIENISQTHIDDILSGEITVDTSLLKKIISIDDIDIESRQILLSKQLSNFTALELNEQLQKVRLLEIYNNLMSDISKSKNPKLTITEVNEGILEYLKSEGKISSYHEEGSFYRVYSKRNG